MRKYRLVAKKGEGTFSEVLKAQNVKDGRYHAIKCMKNRFESIDQVNNLREIQALRRLSPHDHVITLEEVLYDQPTGRLALVFELMDANLYELIRGRRHYLNPQLIKSYIWQLMKSLDHMHKKGIFHRDIKPENILIESNSDTGKGLKLADFGSCRGIYSKQPYTEYISTRWYRAPECLLTDGYYGPEMDLWGAGCVMFEITSLYPLFPGSNESDQITRIHKILGTPSQEILGKLKSKGASHISFDFPEQKGVGLNTLVPHASPEAMDLMTKLLKYDGSERISAREAMRHPYLKEMRELDMKRAADGVSPTSNAAAIASSGKTGSFNVNGAESTMGFQDMLGGSIVDVSKSKALPTIDTNAKISKAAAFSPNQTGGASLPPIHNSLSNTQNKQQLLPARGQYPSSQANSNANTMIGSSTNSIAANNSSLGASQGKKKKKSRNPSASSQGLNGSMNLPTQNTEQVMKTYGLQRNHPPVVEAALKQQFSNEGKPSYQSSNRYSKKV